MPGRRWSRSRPGARCRRCAGRACRAAAWSSGRRGPPGRRRSRPAGSVTVASQAALSLATTAATRCSTRSDAACRASVTASVVGGSDGVGVNGALVVPPALSEPTSAARLSSSGVQRRGSGPAATRRALPRVGDQEVRSAAYPARSPAHPQMVGAGGCRPQRVPRTAGARPSADRPVGSLRRLCRLSLGLAAGPPSRRATRVFASSAVTSPAATNRLTVHGFRPVERQPAVSEHVDSVAGGRRRSRRSAGRVQGRCRSPRPSGSRRA